MLRYIATFILLIGCCPAFAQVMEGSVVDSSTKNTIAGVTVINRHSGTVVFSDNDGHYAIQALSGDTLLFRHTAYQQVQEVMTFTMGTRFKSILMQPLAYMLKEATVTGMTKYQQDSVELHQQFDHELKKPAVANPKYTGLGVDGLFGWAADKITGNSKKPKRFKKQFAADDQAKFIDSRYTPQLVATMTGQKDTDSIAAFIYAYPMEYEFARSASDLELKAWIRNNYRDYLQKTVVKKQ